MLTPLPAGRVYLATDPVDLRRGHDGLCALVRGSHGLDPYDGTIFVFVGRRGDRIKLLYWDHGGFVLVYKRLERGRFRLPKVATDAKSVSLDASSLAMLLDGVDLTSVRRIPAWKPRAARVTRSPAENTIESDHLYEGIDIGDRS